MALFGGKGLRIEVADGIDIESGITLSGDKATIGTGAADTLRLGEADIVAAQMTFQKRGDNWEYFVSDRGKTQIKGGHPRADRVKPGQEFRLGASARLVVSRTAAPPPVAETPDGKPPPKADIPIAVAIPILALVVLGAFVVVTQLRGDGGSGAALATTQWFVQAQSAEPALDACLAAAADLPDQTVARTAPDWAFRAWVRAADKTAPEALAARATILAEVRDAITRAHFLHDAGQSSEASALYRRLENAIPLGSRDCPILAATRRDLAVLEMMGQN